MGGVRPAPLRQAQAAGGSGRDRYGYSVSVLLPTHHKKVRTCRTRQIRARSPGSDFLMIRIQMPAHWNNHSAPTPIRPQPGPDAMARGCVPRELGDRPTSVLEVLVFYIYEIVLFLLLFLLFFRSSQYTAQILVGRGRRGRGQASFSEARRNLSRKAGKKGGEIWPPSQISSAHVGEVLQEFSVICAGRPFFLPSGFSSCRRGNKKLSQVLPRPPRPNRRPWGVPLPIIVSSHLKLKQ